MSPPSTPTQTLANADRDELIAGYVMSLGISRDAATLYVDSEVVDLHIDSFIWTRILGYDLHRRHRSGMLGRAFYGQVDFPRAVEAQLKGAVWIITTNPFRSGRGRARAFSRNLARLKSIMAAAPHLRHVCSASEYLAARSAGLHGAFLGIQGGNAVDADIAALEAAGPEQILRVTLVHLSSSGLGPTSFPVRTSTKSLNRRAHDYIEYLREKRIFLDLAHLHRQAFFDALEMHGSATPVLVTHTGVSGIADNWRNIDDDQLRAIAKTGGLVGIMFHSQHLGEPVFRGTAARIVDHLEHAVRTIGDDHVALGSDFDGAIVPPRDLPSVLELPKLVQHMLERGWSAERIRKILGGNFLRVVASVRG